MASSPKERPALLCPSPRQTAQPLPSGAPHSGHVCFACRIKRKQKEYAVPWLHPPHCRCSVAHVARHRIYSADREHFHHHRAFWSGGTGPHRAGWSLDCGLSPQCPSVWAWLPRCCVLGSGCSGRSPLNPWRSCDALWHSAWYPSAPFRTAP